MTTTTPPEPRPRGPRSLQRRLLLYLLLSAPLVWVAALAFSYDRARHEVNELFDSEMIRFARQLRTALGPAAAPASPPPAEAPANQGAAEIEDLAIAVWDRDGRLAHADREGTQLPYRPDATGFVDLTIDGVPWRVYYLQSFDGSTLVAAGQLADERDELVLDLVAGQLGPWLAVLPVLLLAMAWSVRRAMAPLRTLTDELHGRSADDLQPLPLDQTPAELQPLVGAMNGLFARIDETLARERRFTADAAHELRTPLAVLRVHWDVVRRATTPAERQAAEAKLGAGLARLDRLVTQLLALSRLDNGGAEAARADRQAIDAPALLRDVMSDMLPLAERRGIEFECELPPPGVTWLADGSPTLLAALLRNLLDNAVRYAPAGSTVSVKLADRRLVVENALAPQQLADEAALTRLGERFHRPDGQEEPGSGLGVSIVQRIAALHGLELRYERAPGRDDAAPAVLRAIVDAPAA